MARTAEPSRADGSEGERLPLRRAGYAGLDCRRSRRSDVAELFPEGSLDGL